MKKKILAFVILLITSVSSIAQDITVNLVGSSSDIAGQAHTEYLATYGTDMHVVDFNINNDSSGDKVWRITRRIMNETAGWGNYFCWGALGQIGNCYDASLSEYFYSDTVTIAPGGTGALWTYVSAPANGSALYRYYVTSADSTVFEDSVDLQINGITGINEIDYLSFNTFPNPANGVFQITTESNELMEYRIVNTIGQKVNSGAFTKNHIVQASRLEEGIYFVIVSDQRGRTKTNRIVVHH